MNRSAVAVCIASLLTFAVSCEGPQKPPVPENEPPKTEKAVPASAEGQAQTQSPKDATVLTEAERAAYGNRAGLFNFLKAKGSECPDLDWREVLADWLAKDLPMWSQGFEELIIRDYFRDMKGGFFLDVGCWLPDEGSTTYYLEHDLYWHGIAVDVNPEYAEGWQKKRPKSKFICFAVWDTDGQKITLHVKGQFATLDKKSGEDFLKNVMGETGEMQEVEVTTITLNTLLEQNGVEAIDFLSLDIEGAEPAALKGFDIQRYKPALCCVEAHESDSVIMEYFKSNGYELIEKYRKVDKINLYFRPIKTESNEQQKDS